MDISLSCLNYQDIMHYTFYGMYKLLNVLFIWVVLNSSFLKRFSYSLFTTKSLAKEIINRPFLGIRTES